MLYCNPQRREELAVLLGKYGMTVEFIADGEVIPGSFWGDSEAGLIANRLYVREDTPLHSALHEACHYICMDQSRRQGLHTDAGGGYDEENGVCYLQILLTECLPKCTRDQAFADMDAWGYSFRLGSTRAWFEDDAEDALAWLERYGIIENQTPTWRTRDDMRPE